MSHSWAKMWAHFIFSTKGRVPIIDDALREQLYPYMSGIINRDFGFTRSIGGTSDHIHLLVSMKTTACAADVMRVVKSNSSLWVHRKFRLPYRFAWQTGYGAFSIGASGLIRTIRYINNQKQHHLCMTFEEEFRYLLEKYDVEYDPETFLE